METLKWFLESNWKRHNLYGSRLADNLSFFAGAYKGFTSVTGAEFYTPFYAVVLGSSIVLNFLEGREKSRMLDHGMKNKDLEGLKQSLRGLPINGLEMLAGEVFGKFLYHLANY